ncbi:hypothetical protein D3C83_105440 [compost metagenome]
MKHVEGVGELVLFATRLDLDRHRDVGFRKADPVEGQRMLRRRERIVGVRVPELGDDTDIAGAKLLYDGLR